jgi:hypothetical protein
MGKLSWCDFFSVVAAFSPFYSSALVSSAITISSMAPGVFGDFASYTASA